MKVGELVNEYGQVSNLLVICLLRGIRSFIQVPPHLKCNDIQSIDCHKARLGAAQRALTLADAVRIINVSHIIYCHFQNKIY